MSFPSARIYLAGPITGLSYGEARNGWRVEFEKLLPPHIHCHSPMRGKDFLFNQTCLQGDPKMYPDHALSRPEGIITRDENDIRMSDALVGCFLGAKVASIGTCHEFGMARILRKPVIMIIEKDGAPGPDGKPTNPHWHAFLTQTAGYVVNTLEEGALIVSHLLTPGV